MLHGPGGAFACRWLIAMALVTAGLVLVGLALPLVAAADRAAFAVINDIGYGPGWVFELLDPHERLYRGLLLAAIAAALALRGPWVAVGVAVAVMSAATVSYLLLEAIAFLTERPRPQEVIENTLTPPGSYWVQASYPSGHMAVTTAMCAAAALALPPLRRPLLVVVVVIGWSRVAFGAHFPLDILAGALLGYASAAFSVAFAVAVGLLPGRFRWTRSSTAARSATRSSPPSPGSNRSSGSSAPV